MSLTGNEEKALASTPYAVLEKHIMDSNVPKSEAEWWACRRICELQEKLEAYEQSISKIVSTTDE